MKKRVNRELTKARRTSVSSLSQSNIQLSQSHIKLQTLFDSFQSFVFEALDRELVHTFDEV